MNKEEIIKLIDDTITAIETTEYKKEFNFASPEEFYAHCKAQIFVLEGLLVTINQADYIANTPALSGE